MLLTYCLLTLVAFLPTIYAPEAQSQYPWVKDAPQREKDALHKALNEKAVYSHATKKGDIHASVAHGRSPRVGAFLSALDKEIWAGINRCCDDHTHKEKHSFTLQGIKEHNKLECAVCHLHVVYEVSDFANFVGPDKHVGTFQEVLETVADMAKSHPDFKALWNEHTAGIIGIGKLAEDHLPPVNRMGALIPWHLYEFEECVREIEKKPKTGLMAGAVNKATTLLSYATSFGSLVAFGSAVVLSQVNSALTKIQEDKEKATVSGVYVPGSNRRPEANNQPGRGYHAPHCVVPLVMSDILAQLMAQFPNVDGMPEMEGDGHERNNAQNTRDDDEMSEGFGSWTSRDSDNLAQPKGAAAQPNHPRNTGHERNHQAEMSETSNHRNLQAKVQDEADLLG